MEGEMAVRVWNFYDAPEELRALSNNGGDEDFIIMAETTDAVDVDLAGEVAARLQVCDSQETEHNGLKVFITCHA
jgi:hypothetical protein